VSRWNVQCCVTILRSVITLIQSLTKICLFFSTKFLCNSCLPPKILDFNRKQSHPVCCQYWFSSWWYSCIHSIDINSFISDLQSSRLITNPPTSLGSLLISYNTTLSSLLDKHAPVITKFSERRTKSNSWFIATLHAFRSTLYNSKIHCGFLSIVDGFINAV